MAESGGHFERMDFEAVRELEALVAAAGGYAQVSEDLRPRVLEVAGLQRRELRMRRRIERAAVLVITLAAVLSAFRSPADAPARYESRTWLMAGLPKPALVSRVDDVNWKLVDSFTEFRRRQAEVFRSPLVQPGRGA